MDCAVDVLYRKYLPKLVHEDFLLHYSFCFYIYVYDLFEDDCFAYVVQVLMHPSYMNMQVYNYYLL